MQTDIQTTDAPPGSIDPVVRRRRVIYVPENYVLALLGRGLIHNQFIRVPEPLGLPETARVVGVWSDWQRNAFGLVVQDPSFEEVPEAIMLPEMQVQWSYVEVAIKSPNSGAQPRGN
jgi:hypothetical protein